MKNNVCICKVLGFDLKQDDVVVYNEQLMLVYKELNHLVSSTVDVTESKRRFWYKIENDMYYNRVTLCEESSYEDVPIETFIDERAY